ncbi:MAG: DedA family protein [bacterium]|nr:DedA family protein [bacterium]
MFGVVEGYLAEFTYAGIFLVLLLCGLGLPLPEDIPIIISGYLAYLGIIDLWAALGVNMAGVLVGDMFIFSMGYWIGPGASTKPILKRMLNRRRMEKVQGFFARHGKKTVFFGRFLSGLRAPTFLAAGITRMSPFQFLLLDGSAALLTVPILLFAAFYFGAQIDTLRALIGNVKAAVLLIFVVGAGGLALGWFLRRRKVRRAENGGPR